MIGVSKSDNRAYGVLVVDDSTFVQKMLQQILASEGFDIIATATNGEEALEAYKKMQSKIDIVTLDITMPKVDGIEALKNILAFDSAAKIVMISALGKESMVKQALVLGAKSYIVKPLDRTKILERIAKVVG